MTEYKLNITRPVNFSRTGKFEAPSPNWVHEDFPLDDYELFVVTNDTLYISYDEEPFIVPSTNLLLLPPKPAPRNRRKGYRASNCSFYWLHFSPMTYQESLSKQSLLYENDPLSTIVLPKQYTLLNVDRVVVLMKQLQDAVRSNYDNVTLNYMTTSILCEIHNQYHNNNIVLPKDRIDSKQIYQDIIDYVHEQILSNPTVFSIAEHFGYNEKYLSYLFRSISGIPLKQYIMRCKMDKANLLLTDTNQSITHISDLLGYSDCHNFMKAYKKVTGLTPSEFRNSFSKRILIHK